MGLTIGDKIVALDEEKELIIEAISNQTQFIAKYIESTGTLANGKEIFWRRGFCLKDESTIWRKAERKKSSKEEKLIIQLNTLMSEKETDLLTKISKEKEAVESIKSLLNQDSLSAEVTLLNNPNIPRELTKEMMLITEKIAERLMEKVTSPYINYRVYYSKKIELVFGYIGFNKKIADIDVQNKTISTNSIYWAQALTCQGLLDGEDSESIRVIAAECYDAFKLVVQFLQENGFTYKEEGFNQKAIFAFKTQFRWEEDHSNELSKKQKKHARKPNQPVGDVTNYYYSGIAEFNITNFLYLTNVINTETLRFYERRLTNEESEELKTQLNRIAHDYDVERRPKRGMFKTTHDDIAIYHVESNSSIEFFDNGQVVAINHNPSDSDPIEKRIPLLNLMWEYKFWKWFKNLSLATYNDAIN